MRTYITYRSIWIREKKVPLFVECDEKGNYYEYLTGTLLANTNLRSNYKEPLKGIWATVTYGEKSPVEFEKALNGLTERDKERMAEQFRASCKKAEEFYNRHMEQERISNQANDDAAVRLNRRRKY